MNHDTANGNRLVRCALALVLCCASFLFASPAWAEEDSGVQVASAKETSGPLPADVTIIARVTPEVTNIDLEGENPHFVFEPDADKTARDNVNTLCARVIDDESLNITLAVSPALLSTWLEIEDGNKSTVHESLENALATGRLEIASLGYTDPGLGLLADADALDEIEAQYALGTALPLGFAKGTVPIDLSLPEGAAVSLNDVGLSWTVVDAEYVTPLSSEGAYGLYTSAEERNLTVLSADTASSALWTADGSDAARTMLSGFNTSHPGGSYVGIVDIGGDTRAASQLCSNLSALARTNDEMLKTATTLADNAADRGVAPTLAEVDAPASQADADFIKVFGMARDNATSLKYILYSSSTTYDRIHLMLMLSECGAPLDGKLRSDCCYAADEVAGEFFDNVHILIEPIVLASMRGDVPLTVINDTDAALQLTYSYEGEDGLSVPDEDNDRQTIVYSGANEVEVPVTLSDEGGKLTVSLVAEQMSIATETIDVHSSNIDRISIVICIILALGIVAVLIWHHRRKATRQTEEGEE